MKIRCDQGVDALTIVFKQNTPVDERDEVTWLNGNHVFAEGDSVEEYSWNGTGLLRGRGMRLTPFYLAWRWSYLCVVIITLF
jgi:hypothetical protein